MASNLGITPSIEHLRAQTQVQANSIKSIDFMGEPAYVLLIHADDPHLRRGDVYNIIIEISGAGDVECAKITISSPLYLVDGGITFRYKLSADLPPEMHTCPLPAFLELPLMVFTNFNYRINPVTGYTSLSNVGEWYNSDKDKRDPILSFSFKIAKNAPKGDHKVFLNLTYKSQKIDQWYTDKQEINIHIDHWYEDERLKYLVIAPIIPAIVVAWSGIINPLYGYLNSIGVPLIVEFAEISFIAMITTVLLDFLFERI
jgi:hypothetical protein